MSGDQQQQQEESLHEASLPCLIYSSSASSSSSSSRETRMFAVATVLFVFTAALLPASTGAFSLQPATTSPLFYSSAAASTRTVRRRKYRNGVGWSQQQSVPASTLHVPTTITPKTTSTSTSTLPSHDLTGSLVTAPSFPHPANTNIHLSSSSSSSLPSNAKAPSYALFRASPAVAASARTTPVSLASATAVAAVATTSVASWSSVLDAPWIDATGSKAKRLLAYYIHLCETRPLLTKAVTSCIVSGLGAVLSQFLAGTASVAINWNRIKAFMLVGLLFEGPFYTWWYDRLWSIGRKIEAKKAGSSKFQTLVQILIDQTVGVALFYPAYFYVYEIFESVVTGRIPRLLLAHSQCQSEILTVLRLQYCIWPFATWMMFRYVPESLRVLASNLVAVVWDTIVSPIIAGPV